MSRRWSLRQAGFTLLELMIVVAVVGILASIAYPIYIDQVIKSRRSDGKALLMSVVSRQEQFFLDNKTYTNNMMNLGFGSDPESTERGYYTVAIATSPAIPYLITATPVAGTTQASDAICGALTINNEGGKGQGGSATDISTCW